MPTADSSALILMNARVGARDLSSVRIASGRIAGLRVRPQPGDRCIDLRGDRVLPGLINAHDHLQLNALPRLKYRDRYAHAKDWIDDIRPRLQFDATLLANNAVPREERLLIGGVKNLLSGVTTVAHHDPLYSCLQEATFPVRVVTRYGWSHSLSLDGAKSVRASHHQTPAGWPWIIHAAEGTDAAAATEFERLESLGCLTANTVIVHGVALSREQQQRLVEADAGLVWCPSSNLHLFARTLDVHTLFAHQRVALGSDSRVTGERDLLGELRVAREVAELDERSLEVLVTEQPARLLRLPDRGVLEAGALGDLLVLPDGLPLSRASRADVRLVLIGGVPQYADPEYAEACGSEFALARVQIDGRTKYLAQSLVARLSGAQVHEPGLVMSQSMLAATA